MDETNAFFTQTIVGAPFSMPLGRRLTPDQALQNGLQIEFDTGQRRIQQAWHDGWVLSHDGDRAGQPRMRPSRLRSWLERHALWLAWLGLASLMTSLVGWGIVFWS